jgi:hypothetical protein
MKNKELDDKLIPERREESEDVPGTAVHFCVGIYSIEDDN